MSRRQVLAGDFAGDGELELLIATMNGRLLAARAVGVPAHPLNAWLAAPRGRRNGFVHGRHEGVFVHAHSARFRDVLGEALPITFEVRNGAVFKI